MSIDDTIVSLRAEVRDLGPARPGRRFPGDLRQRLREVVEQLGGSRTDREHDRSEFARGPMGHAKVVVRRRLARDRDDLGHLLRREGRRCTRPISIAEDLPHQLRKVPVRHRFRLCFRELRTVLGPSRSPPADTLPVDS